MTLAEKIVNIYPELKDIAFIDIGITIQNDGNGQYISKWEHPTLARPTDEQLAGVQ